MKLTDVRKMAIRQQTRVRFRLSDGTECVVNEDGIARMPGIRDVPQLNLEDEFSQATEVQLETPGNATKTSVRTVSRAELERLVSNQPVPTPDDHDE